MDRAEDEKTVKPNKASQELTLGQLLGQVCRLVGHRRRMKMERIGLHHAQAMILFLLWREDGICQRSLADALHISPPTATNTLKRMERDGWITRSRDESDQRIVRVSLTEKARMLRQEARSSFQELDQEMTSMMSQAEIESLSQSLWKVYNYLSLKTPEEADSPCIAGATPVLSANEEKTR